MGLGGVLGSEGRGGAGGKRTETVEVDEPWNRMEPAERAELGEWAGGGTVKQMVRTRESLSWTGPGKAGSRSSRDKGAVN